MANDLWRTPPELFERYNHSFNFTLDPAANHEHHLVNNYYCDPAAFDGNPRLGCLGYDGLEHSWAGHRVFLNPPYGRRQLGIWLKKAYNEALKGCLVLALIPVDPSTQWWDYVRSAQSVEYLRRRVRFLDENNKPSGTPTFASAVVGFW